MSGKSTEKVGSFTARDPNGKQYTIDVFQEYVHANTRDGQDKIAGLKLLKTAEGQNVNHIAKGRYRTVGIREVDLVSDDPAAT